MPDGARAGFLTASASCADSSRVTLAWTFYEEPELPVDVPEWVGYDVLRHSLDDCSAVRVNAEPFPRIPGATHSHTYTEDPPALRTTFEYRVIPVDSNRAPVSLGSSCWSCVAIGWTSCPEFSAPLTHGVLDDWGWALFVWPCGGCFRPFYFEDRDIVQELRPLVGTGTAVRLFGSAYCGTIEGCGMFVDHYDLMPCSGPTPTRRFSWGQVKIIYR